jgi:hypothetical protein
LGSSGASGRKTKSIGGGIQAGDVGMNEAYYENIIMKAGGFARKGDIYFL